MTLHVSSISPHRLTLTFHAADRFSREELAAVLSLRPMTALEAVECIPSLADFDHRGGRLGLGEVLYSVFAS